MPPPLRALRSSASTGCWRRNSKDIAFAEIAEAVRCIVAWRNAMIEAYRAGGAGREALDRANALVSLAHGAEYPLVGFHRDRIEQARDEIARLEPSVL